MATVLPRLRDDLDVLPSPLPDRPGLLLRDPFRYADAAIILPPLLVRCLTCFDGAHTDEDLRAVMGGLTGGRLELADAPARLARALSDGGFLKDDAFRALRGACHRAFAASPVRTAAFAGGGYPDEQTTLERTLETWISSAAPPPVITPRSNDPVAAIAAPHVSPAGGISSYGAAYSTLGPELADRTFVILGTSHYGRPNRFGITRKNFQTPLGEAVTDGALVDHLARAAPEAIDLEDYCHAVEHSIEFQVLFLQSRFGPRVRILPILCGPFANGSSGQGWSAAHRPEDDPGVARLLDALGELGSRSQHKLLWVLGVDMAHVGRRYGDAWDARAHEGAMAEVTTRDRARLDRVTAGDAAGFWHLLHERGADDLKWCGSAPLYAFLHAHPQTRGHVLHYDHWNIDEQSVVSFAALSFSGA